MTVLQDNKLRNLSFTEIKILKLVRWREAGGGWRLGAMAREEGVFRIPQKPPDKDVVLAV